MTTGESRLLRMTCHPSELPEEEEGKDPARTVTIVVEDVTDYGRARRELRESLESARAELEERRRESDEDTERKRQQNACLVEGNR